MAQTALAINLSPDGFTYELEGKQRIVLDSPDRIDLQRYLLEGMTLPSNEDAMKSAYYLDDEQMKGFTDLLRAFQDIQQHCSDFYNGAYTNSVLLSSSIVQFNLTAQTYLKGISTIADDFEHGRITSDYAEKAVTSLIKLMTDQLDKFIADSDEVCCGVNRFLDETYQDNVVLNGQDGKSGLKKEYEDKYKLSESDIQQMGDDIIKAKQELVY